jgi:hypothetical protein
MHPRETRNRPLCHFQSKGYYIFMHDGSNSSNLVRPILDALFSVDGFHGLETWADVVSCYKVVPIKTKAMAQLEQVQYFVEFWNGNAMDRKGAVLSVDVFAPSHWTAEYFLEALENSARKHGAITILSSNTLNGVVFNLNTINTIHHSFK